MPYSTQVLISIMQEKIEQLENLKVDIEKQRLRHELHCLENNEHSKSTLYSQKKSAINSTLSSLHTIKSNATYVSSEHEPFLLQEFYGYLKQDQTKGSTLNRILLEQKNWEADLLSCNQKLQVQKNRLNNSKAYLRQNANSRDNFASIGAVMGATFGFGGSTLGILLLPQYGILAILYPPFWLIFGVVAVISALVISLLFCGLHLLVTADTVKKEQQKIKETQQIIDDINGELTRFDKKQVLVKNMILCCNGLESLLTADVPESHVMRNPIHVSEAKASENTNAFFAHHASSEPISSAVQENGDLSLKNRPRSF